MKPIEERYIITDWIKNDNGVYEKQVNVYRYFGAAIMRIEDLTKELGDRYRFDTLEHVYRQII